MEIHLKEMMSTQLKTIHSDETLSNAFAKFKVNSIRHLPVLDNEGKLVGLLTEQDLQKAQYAETLLDAHGLAEGPIFKRGARVEDYMSRNVICLTETCELLTAVQAMVDEEASAVIVTRNNEMIGILTHVDLLRLLTVILKKNETLPQKMEAFAYNSSLGSLVNFLAGIGI